MRRVRARSTMRTHDMRARQPAVRACALSSPAPAGLDAHMTDGLQFLRSRDARVDYIARDARALRWTNTRACLRRRTR